MAQEQGIFPNGNGTRKKVSIYDRVERHRKETKMKKKSVNRPETRKDNRGPKSTDDAASTRMPPFL